MKATRSQVQRSRGIELKSESGCCRRVAGRKSKALEAGVTVTDLVELKNASEQTQGFLEAVTFSGEIGSELEAKELVRTLPASVRTLTLNLFTSNMTSEVRAALFGLLRPLPLKVLNVDLRFHSVDGQGLAMIVQSLPLTLEALTLDLSGNAVDDASLANFAEFLPATLKELSLNLNVNCIGDDGVVALAMHLPRALKKLDLGLAWNAVSDVSLSALAFSLPATLLHLSLKLGWNPSLTEHGAQALAAGFPPLLRSIDLGLEGTKIGDGGVAALARALPLGLTRLSAAFSCTKTTAVAAEAVAAAIAEQDDLEAVDLCFTNNQIGARGALAIGASLKPTLKSVALKLDQNGIGSGGVGAVMCHVGAQVEELMLSFTGNAICDQGALMIASHLPAGLTKLQLRLNGNEHLSSRGALSILEAIPIERVSDFQVWTGLASVEACVGRRGYERAVQALQPIPPNSVRAVVMGINSLWSSLTGRDARSLSGSPVNSGAS